MATKYSHIILIIILSLISFAQFTYSETVTQQAVVTFDVSEIFSLEFYTDQNVLYDTSIPFSNMDPTMTFVYPDGRQASDGKSDTGVVCISNTDEVWYLKIHAESTAPFTLDKIFYYFGQPWNRNTNQPSDGQLLQEAAWHNLPSEPSAVYGAGDLDRINTPFGTLCTFSFAINPSGLYGGQTYGCQIVYTFTSSP